MKISRTSFRVLVMVMIALFLVSVSFFVLTSVISEPVDNTLSGMKEAKTADLAHCLLLEKNEVYYVVEGKKIKIAYADLRRELATKTNLLQQPVVNIVCTKETGYQQIVSVLDIMSEKNIKSYQLLKI
ncbi:biopolymer transporter ExbD [Sediminibacterium sp.]|uniref:biopolymer transporter ExbD n=1 Tax=Sediminibacterium sp. TaxID=1917865 RepID=UPI0025F84BC3|nr:biopolymer transporter ExbD [Sediminibacterium sp.]MBW0179284.1 biopolymer transporter ExbD [Sediminibacterium sp.]